MSTESRKSSSAIAPTVLFIVLFVGATVLCGQDKIRVFVTDSQSWEARGAVAASGNGAGGTYGAGARPQTAEIIKTVGERCQQLTVTNNREKADYVLTLDHEGGKKIAQKDNKWALYNKDGDVIGSGSTRALGSAIKDACEAIERDRKNAK